jgi:hypothetical protein
VSEDDRVNPESPWRGRLELLTVVVLSVTTILTAWSAFQSSKWGGAMSIAFSQASTARIEAARLDGTANERQGVQVGLWTQWVDATSTGDTARADFIEERFPEPLASAQVEWLALSPLEDPGAPPSPFALDSYVVPEREEARAADARADEKFAEALANNQRGDNYTLMTVLFAAVLFFTAMSGRVRNPRSQIALLTLAIGLGVLGITFLAVFPKLV